MLAGVLHGSGASDSWRERITLLARGCGNNKHPPAAPADEIAFFDRAAFQYLRHKTAAIAECL